jgi:hypothetical protein
MFRREGSFPKASHLCCKSNWEVVVTNSPESHSKCWSLGSLDLRPKIRWFRKPMACAAGRDFQFRRNQPRPLDTGGRVSWHPFLKEKDRKGEGSEPRAGSGKTARKPSSLRAMLSGPEK